MCGDYDYEARRLFLKKGVWIITESAKPGSAARLLRRRYVDIFTYLAETDYHCTEAYNDL